MTQAPLSVAVRTTNRRRMLGVGAAGAALGLVAVPAAAAVTRARARYRLSVDYAVPVDTMSVVPWTDTVFQTGSDVTLQADGRLLINRSALYEFVFSGDWDAKSGNDIDLRKIGIWRQAVGQPDWPMDAHERLGFLNLPGSNPPAVARYQGDWSPPPLPLMAMASTEITVSPPGVARPGDAALVSLSSINRTQMDDDALSALSVQAKVVAPDTVRVTLFNPCIETGISVAAGMLRVAAMSLTKTRGSNDDAWMVLHTSSVELFTGERVYGVIQHKVEGTLLQATRSSYLQIDRLE